MFSPRAENLLIPGRLDAALRSRWEKSAVLAMCRDQPSAILARLGSQVRAARPLASRSAFRRLKSSWVIRSATVSARLVGVAPVDEGADPPWLVRASVAPQGLAGAPGVLGERAELAGLGRQQEPGQR